MFDEHRATAGDPRRFSDPLVYLQDAHEAQLQACEALIWFSGDPERWGDNQAARRFHIFLAHDLPMHVADENIGLLPMLRQRGLLAAEDPDAALVECQHRRDSQVLARLLPELAQLVAGRTISVGLGFATRASAFVHGYRLHLELETRTVLPLAAQLERTDRRQVLATMTAYRQGRPAAGDGLTKASA